MIREIEKKDRPRLMEIIHSINLFSKQEKDCALELIDEVLFNHDTHYQIYVIENNSIVYGYYCLGHRALTEGVYDLYWIVVDPECQDKGLGSQLLKHSEEIVKSKSGYIILVETSSRKEFYSTVKFYKKNNYTATAEICDFYSPGDNLLILRKTLNNGG